LLSEGIVIELNQTEGGYICAGVLPDRSIDRHWSLRRLQGLVSNFYMGSFGSFGGISDLQFFLLPRYPAISD
jgi:hypothetical protein